ncbi:PREDICTED: uncharacterized protein LOC109589732 [Amphimedon queenslandica]|uniref:Uncharacterized protein n=1 Tax=Amphimedon queenslandica TaxID=400682 RepID=A0A1X7T519_AMPQE|nr:PREDICTED: uncharacterized protein LOC109589732 [Amphimedon queenslandica]|eukprot:XP_019861322.1 PREDICTED: uncharacterized protein LOC109589732 [Amphimedon queenslandica]
MEMDIEDNITDRCMWAEVGKNDSGNVFILVGTSRIEYNAIATFSSEELKALTEDKVALDISNEIGWKIKVEVLAAEKQIKVALLPASEQKPLIKQIGYSFNENGNLVAGTVKTIGTPNDGKKGEEKEYSVPEDSYEGPRLEIGEDYSKNRKNDYETETVGK